ncbi:MAG TPA: AMP-binding acetyl-CoA synthetase, partial [Solimonas sp.]|nr:AMP-binding acetyl-CoA synthetase [Solimonas sp.]
YYKAQDKAAEDMTPDGFLKTGDMGEIDEMGRLRITGRVKELFKTSKGKYVAPVPVEQKLANHPAVESVCVAGFDLPQPIALMMLSPDAFKALKDSAGKETLAQQLGGLLDQVNHTLEDHEQMDYIVVVKEQWTMDNGFLTPTMKIKRNVIEGHYAPKVPSWSKAKQVIVWE